MTQQVTPTGGLVLGAFGSQQVVAVPVGAQQRCDVPARREPQEVHLPWIDTQLASMGAYPPHSLCCVDGGVGIGGVFPQRVAQHEHVESATQESNRHRIGLALRQHHVAPTRGDDHRGPGMLQRGRLLLEGRSVEEDSLQAGGSLLVQINGDMTHDLIVEPGVRGRGHRGAPRP